MSCCGACDLGYPCDGIPYDAVPLDYELNTIAPMSWGYAGAGGANHLRLAQTIGTNGWTKQLGELGQPYGFDVPGTCPPGQEWNLSTLSCQPIDPTQPPPELPPPPGVPGGLPVVTEQQCAARESAAYAKGKDDERGKLIITTAITAVVSGVIGVAIAKVFR